MSATSAYNPKTMYPLNLGIESVVMGVIKHRGILEAIDHYIPPQNLDRPFTHGEIFSLFCASRVQEENMGRKSLADFAATIPLNAWLERHDVEPLQVQDEQFPELISAIAAYGPQKLYEQLEPLLKPSKPLPKHKDALPPIASFLPNTKNILLDHGAATYHCAALCQQYLPDRLIIMQLPCDGIATAACPKLQAALTAAPKKELPSTPALPIYGQPRPKQFTWLYEIGAYDLVPEEPGPAAIQGNLMIAQTPTENGVNYVPLWWRAEHKINPANIFQSYQLIHLGYRQEHYGCSSGGRCDSRPYDDYLRKGPLHPAFWRNSLYLSQPQQLEALMLVLQLVHQILAVTSGELRTATRIQKWDNLSVAFVEAYINYFADSKLVLWRRMSSWLYNYLDEQAPNDIMQLFNPVFLEDYHDATFSGIARYEEYQERAAKLRAAGLMR